MKVLRTLLFATIFASTIATAQTLPRFDLSAGYSFSSVALGPKLGTRSGLNGWNASFTSNFNRWLALTEEFATYYGSPTIPSSAPILCPSTNPECIPGGLRMTARMYTGLLGPTFTYRTEKASPFAQVLFGISALSLYHGQEPFASALGCPTLESCKSFTTNLGLGLDYNINPTVTLRVEPQYLMTHFLGTPQHDFRLATGLVVHIGHFK